jgi:hypothetical protein
MTVYIYQIMIVNSLTLSPCFYIDHIVSLTGIFSQYALFITKYWSLPEIRLNIDKKNDLFQFLYIDYVDEYSCVLTMIKTW